MAERIKIEELSNYLQDGLKMYGQEITEAVDQAASEAIRDLQKETRRTAPKGARGKYAKYISQKRKYRTERGSAYIWYVRAPEYRLTHLLVKGHATRNGGRTRPNPFLQNALSKIVPRYIRKVEEAVKNGK